MEKNKATFPLDTSLTNNAKSSRKRQKILLRLFIAGFSPRSQSTIDTLHKICDDHLDGNYQLEIVDIYQQPDLARKHQILATPTLLKYEPQPKKTMIGDLSQLERVLKCFGLTA